MSADWLPSEDDMFSGVITVVIILCLYSLWAYLKLIPRYGIPGPREAETASTFAVAGWMLSGALALVCCTVVSVVGIGYLGRFASVAYGRAMEVAE